jgi:hypothetical protein
VRENTKPCFLHHLAGEENARSRSGVLVIEGRKKMFANPGFQRWLRQLERAEAVRCLTSVRLLTTQRQSELCNMAASNVRAKIPTGQGHSGPAIWTLASNSTQIG